MTPKLSGLIVPYTNTGHHRCSELKLSSPQGTRYLHLNSHQKGESQRSYWLGKAEAERRAWCKLGRLQGGWEEREREGSKRRPELGGVPAGRVGRRMQRPSWLQGVDGVSDTVRPLGA
ncbi:hypothetical protein SETIT_9G485500v2 [Setaria italica]|uniref:Uncharacterized protein n=1 Tax=Setaria italica TaxID=4555 RepID=A0A368STU6_SETIT|nr:hypothetical protein SETIT_9G485500v2 [Setaria italica]